MGLGLILSAALQWRILPLSASVDKIMDDRLFQHNNILTRKPRRLCCCRLELTLINKLPTSLIDKLTGKPWGWGEYWHVSQFAQSALLPRQFTVILEQGNFKVIHEEGEKRFGLRLMFDKPPWPTFDGLSQQKQNHRGVQSNWDLMNSTRAFYAQVLDKSAFGVRATNDDHLWGYKMASCVMS